MNRKQVYVLSGAIALLCLAGGVFAGYHSGRSVAPAQGSTISPSASSAGLSQAPSPAGAALPHTSPDTPKYLFQHHGLGIQFELPSGWAGQYAVSTRGLSVEFFMHEPSTLQLFSVTALRPDDEAGLQARDVSYRKLGEREGLALYATWPGGWRTILR